MTPRSVITNNGDPNQIVENGYTNRISVPSSDNTQEKIVLGTRVKDIEEGYPKNACHGGSQCNAASEYSSEVIK